MLEPSAKLRMAMTIDPGVKQCMAPDAEAERLLIPVRHAPVNQRSATDAVKHDSQKVRAEVSIIQKSACQYAIPDPLKQYFVG